jgi:AcrR family transcriptional regulator
MTSTRFAQIRSAALEAFYRNGYHGTSLREIASDVGIRTPSLYNYIGSKQRLLYELMTDVMTQLHDRTRTAIEQVGDRPADRLKAAISAFVLFNVEHPHEAAVSDAGFAALSDEQRRTIIELRDRFDDLFAEAIDDGLADGSFHAADAGLAKTTILSACARVYFWHRPDGRLAPDEVAAAVSDYLVRGLTNPFSPDDAQR